MKILVESSYEYLSRTAADIVQDVVARKPDAVLLLATGNTPVGLYRELAARRQIGLFDASQVRVVQLDAYLGLTSEDPRSLYGWLDREFLRPLAIPEENVIRFPGDTVDPDKLCLEFDRAIESVGGIDLSVLGLGPNGHLGFNEPPSASNAPTRKVRLTPESIVSNAVYWGSPEQVPEEALTAGMTVLLAAKSTLLLVSGAHKRDILRRTLLESPSKNLPASLLQTSANVTVIADIEAYPGVSSKEPVA
jgi:glucosamine-6-phosphate deaminase